VIKKNDLEKEALPDSPQVAGVGQLATATWQAGGKVYLLVAFSEAELRKRL
jgi:hypothetical protein